uniref:Timeless C-terminal domain-containing protein n=1 Tax=Strigamia maritima TaxID=126957 RepID=T1IWC9_STRMM
MGFASPRVLQPYTVLLRNFANNSMFTNHCIAKMFHRIAWDLKSPGLLYQATIFRSFQKLFLGSTNVCYKELVKLGKFVMETFFTQAKSNNKIFMEILFWKGSTEVFEMEQGYGSYDTSKKTKQLWSEEEEDELRRLYDEFKDGDTDVVDCIMNHLIDKNKTRRQVMAQLKRQNLITDVKQLSKRPIGKRASCSSAWSEDEEARLRNLFTEHKDSLVHMPDINDDQKYIFNKILIINIVGNIELGLEVKHSKRQIIDRILQLGLVANKKELHKKRSSTKLVKRTSIDKSRHEPERDEDSSETDTSSDEYEDDLEEENLASLIITAELKTAVEWLRDALKEASDERTDGDIEPTALVALSSDIVDAFNDSNFINILLKFTLSPPEEGQESFWRIPRCLTSAMLNKRIREFEDTKNKACEVRVNLPLDGDLGQEKSQKQVQSKVNSHEETDTDGNQSPVEMSTEESNHLRPTEINKSRRKKEIVLDSSDDDIPLGTHRNSSVSSNTKSRKLSEEHSFATNKSRRILHVEDESSDDELPSFETLIQEQTVSSENNLSGYKRRLLDEDDDDDEAASHQPLKRMCYISEDSDGESEAMKVYVHFSDDIYDNFLIHSHAILGHEISEDIHLRQLLHSDRVPSTVSHGINGTGMHKEADWNIVNTCRLKSRLHPLFAESPQANNHLDLKKTNHVDNGSVADILYLLSVSQWKVVGRHILTTVFYKHEWAIILDESVTEEIIRCLAQILEETPEALTAHLSCDILNIF